VPGRAGGLTSEAGSAQLAPGDAGLRSLPRSVPDRIHHGQTISPSSGGNDRTAVSISPARGMYNRGDMSGRTTIPAARPYTQGEHRVTRTPHGPWERGVSRHGAFIQKGSNIPARCSARCGRRESHNADLIRTGDGVAPVLSLSSAVADDRRRRPAGTTTRSLC